jgi:hypothetical protein
MMLPMADEECGKADAAVVPPYVRTVCLDS